MTLLRTCTEELLHTFTRSEKIAEHFRDGKRETIVPRNAE